MKTLPSPGGLLDQDAFQVLVLQIVYGAILQKEEHEMKKAQKKGK